MRCVIDFFTVLLKQLGRPLPRLGQLLVELGVQANETYGRQL